MSQTLFKELVTFPKKGHKNRELSYRATVKVLEASGILNTPNLSPTVVNITQTNTFTDSHAREARQPCGTMNTFIHNRPPLPSAILHRFGGSSSNEGRKQIGRRGTTQRASYPLPSSKLVS